MDRVEQKARANEKMVTDIFEMLGRRSKEMKEFYDALAEQEAKVDMRLDALEEKTKEFSVFGGTLKREVNALFQKVEELEESRALLEAQVESLAGQVCRCGEVPIVPEEVEEPSSPSSYLTPPVASPHENASPIPIPEPSSDQENVAPALGSPFMPDRLVPIVLSRRIVYSILLHSTLVLP